MNGFRKHPKSPKHFSEFFAEFARGGNRHLIDRGAGLACWKSEPDKIVEASPQCFRSAKLEDRAEKQEARKAELIEVLDNAEEPPPSMHPDMAQIYQDRIASP